MTSRPRRGTGAFAGCRSCRLIATLLATFVAGLLISSIARADIDPAEVRQAIERGKAYLLREQRQDGTWPDWAANEGGVTSLCTLALLNAGVPPEDEQIQRALNDLRIRDHKWTYATALQTMVLCAAQPQRDLALIQKNVKWLEETQLAPGQDNHGAWSYPRAQGDNSNSQFAVMALFEAQRVGVKVSEKTWRQALDYWKRTQLQNGAWGYQPGQPPTGSMTCAGISAVIMCSAQLNPGDATVEGGRVRCCGDHMVDTTIDRALHWLANNFSVHTNPGRGDAWLYYYLYGVERVGRMTAHRFLGDHDWYREGTDLLVRQQDKLSGFWKGLGYGENNPHIGTSFALLFLSKGRRPILMGKLQVGDNDDWNHHRSDAANLTSYVETRWRRDLSWQVINAGAASVDDLTQAPVLYLCGQKAPDLNDAEVRRLREYINQGGFLFAVACCGDGGFDAGFRELMHRAFPEREYELKLLPPDHPVWHAEQPIAPAAVRPLWGINVGCRTSVIYCPDDLSCMWELAQPGRDGRLNETVRQQVLAAQAIGINVLAYATNREVKFKYEVPTAAAAKEKEDPVDRAKLHIAKLRHSGGFDAAPQALPHLQQMLSRATGLRVGTDKREVSIGDAQLFQYPVVFMHGRNAFRLTGQERDNLRQYVERGGVVVADSICASQQFTASFRDEMAAIFAGKPLVKIPANDPIFTTRYGGFDLKKVKRRDPSRGDGEGPLAANVHEVEPELDAIKIEDRYGVIFSPFDLSCALERQESLDCQGYIRDDAARIAINIILYAVQE